MRPRLIEDLDVINNVLEKRLPSVSDIEKVLRFSDVHFLGKIAHELRLKVCGSYGTFIVNAVLNYTNICEVKCRFCAFWRDKRSPDAFTLSVNEILRIVGEIDRTFGPLRQVLIQGGINPDITIEYLEELFRRLKEKFPHIAIHALSPLEVYYLSIRERMSVREVLERLREAGLDSMPGGGGEILIDNVRRVISPRKIDSDTWIRVMETAHRLGIKTSATMMYGHIETIQEQAQHLRKILELQLKTSGFNAFIAWNFEPGNTQLGKIVRFPARPVTLLRIVATARLLFRERIPHIQSSWLTNGPEIAQISLLYGADDFGGTLYNEKVIPAAGKQIPVLTKDRIVKLIRDIGLTPAERDNWYNIVEVFTAS